jgi:hypothetical protein
MRVIEQLKQRYSHRAVAPMTVRECAMHHGIKWASDIAQVNEFMARFVICRDGVIRTR